MKLFTCRSIVVATETHEDGGYHYHVGVLNENASRYKCFKQIRALFPEFEGRQINVKVHKGWGIICRYIPKMEKNKVVWGEYSLKQILEIGDASAKDQAIPYKPEKTGGAVVIEKVMKYDEWYDALEDPALKDTIIRSYSNLRGLFEDLKVAKDRQSNVGERLVPF